MNAVDKKLLLIDLSAKLPYGVKLWVKTEETPVELTRIDIENSEVKFYSCKLPLLTVLKISKIEQFEEQIIKPYLRPMSSMTEEEEKEFNEQIYKAKPYSDGKSYNVYEVIGLNTIYLNAHHFDYLGLIEKGLAIEVTKENDPYK